MYLSSGYQADLACGMQSIGASEAEGDRAQEKGSCQVCQLVFVAWLCSTFMPAALMPATGQCLLLHE